METPGPQRPGRADIEARLRLGLGDAAVIQLEDDSQRHIGHAGAASGGHFRLTVVSPRFEGLSRVDRHRLVYDLLSPWFVQGIHAMALVTRTPHEG